jgi:predicted SnoaL-like aldol condensation-catalyzing enzyme
VSARSVVLRYLREAWEQADPTAVDRLLADDYVDHDPPPGFKSDRADHRRLVEAIVGVTSHRRVKIIAMQASATHVTVRHDTSWVQKGPLFGAPAGRRVIRACDLYVVRKGRITTSWHVESFRQAA